MIEREKAHHAVATLCRVLGVSTSGYYAWRNRPLSMRAQADAALQERVVDIHQASRQTYGVLRIQAELRSEGTRCGNRRIARLMRTAGIEGCHRRKRQGTTQRDEARPVGPDLVSRDFTVEAPNELWVADLTYVATWSGFCYVAFVLDAFSHRIVCWRVAASLHAELALDALEMAIWTRRGQPLDGLVHHSDRGVQFLAIRYTERLANEGAVASVGSKGDSYDNALAESLNGLNRPGFDGGFRVWI